MAQPTGTIPDTVHAVIAARIDRLPADEKALLQTLAVIGKEFPWSLMAQVVDRPEAEDAMTQRGRTGEKPGRNQRLLAGGAILAIVGALGLLVATGGVALLLGVGRVRARPNHDRVAGGSQRDRSLDRAQRARRRSGIRVITGHDVDPPRGRGCSRFRSDAW